MTNATSDLNPCDSACMARTPAPIQEFKKLVALAYSGLEPVAKILEDHPASPARDRIAASRDTKPSAR
jgi:hypothetical protein